MNYFEQKIQNINFNNVKKWDPSDKESFGILLSAPSCLVRRWNLQKLEIDNPDIGQMQQLLTTIGITDRNQLAAYIEKRLKHGAGKNYADFLTFWAGEPCYKISEIDDNTMTIFRNYMDYAENYRNIVKEFGFYAWDIAETIPMLRMGLACGMLEYEEAKSLLFEIVDFALEKFSSWEEFGLSFVCGGAYDAYRNTRMNEAEGKKFFDALSGMVYKLVIDGTGNFWSAV